MSIEDTLTRLVKELEATRNALQTHQRHLEALGTHLQNLSERAAVIYPRLPPDSGALSIEPVEGEDALRIRGLLDVGESGDIPVVVEPPEEGSDVYAGDTRETQRSAPVPRALRSPGDDE